MILFTVTILIGMVLNAQETFFPTKEGTVLIYKNFDKKDKLTTTLQYTVKHVAISGSNMDITYLCESFDPKEKPIFKENITIHKKGDKLYLDMSNFINKAAFQQNGQIPAEIQVTGNDMEMPSNPSPGDVLPDANVALALKIGFINVKMAADVTNRKVESIEDITVKGGTFNCYKFSSEVNSSAMGIKMHSKNFDWYAKGIGTVKNENYDKNGNMQSHCELVEVKQ